MYPAVTYVFRVNRAQRGANKPCFRNIRQNVFIRNCLPLGPCFCVFYYRYCFDGFSLFVFLLWSGPGIWALLMNNMKNPSTQGTQGSVHLTFSACGSCSFDAEEGRPGEVRPQFTERFIGC